MAVSALIFGVLPFFCGGELASLPSSLDALGISFKPQLSFDELDNVMSGDLELTMRVSPDPVEDLSAMSMDTVFSLVDLKGAESEEG